MRTTGLPSRGDGPVASGRGRFDARGFISLKNMDLRSDAASRWVITVPRRNQEKTPDKVVYPLPISGRVAFHVLSF
jgi:hypothetical protein